MSKRNAMKYGLRWQILNRDNFTCQHCGQYAPNVQLEVDHIIEVSNGGTDDPSNLITSCWACNRGKEHLRITQEKRKTRKSIPTRQFQMLELLKSNPLTTTEIMEALSIKRGNADQLTKRLREKHLIVKRYDRWFPS